MTNTNINPNEIKETVTKLILSLLEKEEPLSPLEISERTGVHRHFINGRLQVLLLTDVIKRVELNKFKLNKGA